ncbi:hypothetical protein QCA50_009236 [Cerrena zonata]|uniref:Charged multivesicular body protein 6 n=1 Tax=Cerrena zonata TaxID=2478898 RepID=A0AAW0G2W0_9APHY
MGQGPSQPKITAQDRAIFQLKQQRDKLKQYQRKLNSIVERQKSLAKEAVNNKQPEKAKFYLRSKKQQESTILKTYDQLDNLESLIGTIEFKLIEKDVLYGLQEGNKVLSKLNSEMSADKIDKLLDDVEDERLKVDDVLNMLGMGAGLSNSEEHEVDEEFERLQKEAEDKSDIKLPDVPKHENISLPEVPKERIESPQIEQEREQDRDSDRQTHEPLAA